MVNTCIFIGNLGKDAELKHTSSGMAVVKFSMAVESGTRKKPKTSWVQVNVWGKFGESLSQYLLKGKKVYVEGRIDIEKFEDENGQPRTSVSLNANQLQLLSDKNNASEGNTPREATTHEPMTNQDFTADDIPF